jgi:hypothetical protein
MITSVLPSIAPSDGGRWKIKRTGTFSRKGREGREGEWNSKPFLLGALCVRLRFADGRINPESFRDTESGQREGGELGKAL